MWVAKKFFETTNGSSYLEILTIVDLEPITIHIFPRNFVCCARFKKYRGNNVGFRQYSTCVTTERSLFRTSLATVFKLKGCKM